MGLETLYSESCKGFVVGGGTALKSSPPVVNKLIRLCFSVYFSVSQLTNS